VTCLPWSISLADNLVLEAAGAALCDLIVKEADNNVKLIVLDRFDSLREKHPHVLDNLTMDILKVLSRYVQLIADDVHMLT
jgi:vesicle coat complex subunit